MPTDLATATPPTAPVLVTGGTGFLGSHLVERLLATGRKLTIVSRQPRPELVARGIRVVVGPLHDPATCTEAVRGAATVFHVAARVGDEELSDGVAEIARGRFIWLTVNLVTAILASAVISMFTDTIEAIVALAVLMPIVASMGGNAGTQTLTVAVRAIATDNLTSANVRRIVLREGMVGAINGIGFALLIGFLAGFYYGNSTLGVVIGVAMIGNMIVAAFAGVLIPIVLEKAGADPALASGTFVTTITDVFGFFAFLGLAGIMLL